MTGKVVQRPRHAPALDNPGFGADHAPGAADRTGVKLAVRQRPDTQGDIDLILHQIERALREHHAQIDLRIGIEEVERDWQDMHLAKGDRRGDGQAADRRLVFTGCQALGFADVLKDALAQATR